MRRLHEESSGHAARAEAAAERADEALHHRDEIQREKAQADSVLVVVREVENEPRRTNVSPSAIGAKRKRWFATRRVPEPDGTRPILVPVPVPVPRYHQPVPVPVPPVPVTGPGPARTGYFRYQCVEVPV